MTPDQASQNQNIHTCHLERLGSLGDELLRPQRSVAVRKH